MDTNALSRTFHERMIEVGKQAKERFQYDPKRFNQLVARLGGVAAAKQLLEGNTPAEGFGTLFERGGYDGLRISLEAVVALEDQWRPLFTEIEVREARRRLIDVKCPFIMTAPQSASPTRPPEAVGAYAYTRRVGNLLFVSGMGPRQRGSKDIPGVRLDAAGKMIDYDMEAQVRAVFTNIRICLEEAGSRFENIVDVTSFLTDMDRDFAVYNRIYAELFPPGPNQPCRTTVGVASLPTAGNAPIAFEVKVIATV